jgi:FkbM family methyltransferase
MVKLEASHVLLVVCLVLGVAYWRSTQASAALPLLPPPVRVRSLDHSMLQRQPKIQQMLQQAQPFDRAALQRWQPPAQPTAPSTVPAVTEPPTPAYPYYSQSKEDRAVSECMLRGVKNGVYLEIGALDGRIISNTLHFEESKGFKGILIEGEPRNGAKLLKNRGGSGKNYIVNKAACAPGEVSVKYVSGGGALETSGIVGAMSDKFKQKWGYGGNAGYNVSCTTFAQIFKEAAVSAIDVFFLDVEGAEYKVLEGMDWDVQVGVWVIELDGTDPVKDHRVRDLLASHGYEPTKPHWDIRQYCAVAPPCTINEVFVNAYYKERMMQELARGHCKPRS